MTCHHPGVLSTPRVGFPSGLPILRSSHDSRIVVIGASYWEMARYRETRVVSLIWVAVGGGGVSWASRRPWTGRAARRSGKIQNEDIYAGLGATHLDREGILEQILHCIAITLTLPGAREGAITRRLGHFCRRCQDPTRRRRVRERIPILTWHGTVI